jgi:DNA-directed RNA polymerase subunit beta'
MVPRSKKEKLICEWDPYNAVIITESTGKVEFDALIEGCNLQGGIR